MFLFQVLSLDLFVKTGRDDKYKILAEEDDEASWVSSKNYPVPHTYLEPLDLRN